jgi:hypothetical protein
VTAISAQEATASFSDRESSATQVDPGMCSKASAYVLWGLARCEVRGVTGGMEAQDPPLTGK